MKQFQNKLLDGYVELLKKYSTTLDLVSDTALSNIDKKIDECRVYAHLIEELALNTNKVYLDLGSGAGLPGLPLSILLPDWTHYLVERRKRRANFLKIVVSRLQLPNTTVIHNDVKNLNEFHADVVTAQAVTTFPGVYALTQHLHSDKVVLISRKGDDWQQEIAAFKAIPDLYIKAQRVEPLPYHGNVVAVLLSGGHDCQS